jgi:phospholipid/cholesterol/gamma-HCH transport system permease protein
MTATVNKGHAATFTLHQEGDVAELHLAGDWCMPAELPTFNSLRDAFTELRATHWRVIASDSLQWDSQCMARLFQLARHCADNHIELDTAALPESMQKMLALAIAVKPTAAARKQSPGLTQQLQQLVNRQRKTLTDFFGFIGAVVIALGKLLRGRANMRWSDFFYFVEQCGPRALAIVALISVLVGMILAYLGSVQLRRFGAEIYVADLVAIGTMREMGALMTAVIMAGRTGAAYAAQLGTMQVNEEVDAITTLGISPVEYLVLPRLLALVAMMPLLCLLANLLGLLGGAVVATGMDVTATAFIHQARDAMTLNHLGTGLFKSLVFGVLIACAGCQAGLQSGRSSAAVGEATTRAVVNAIVCLVIADAGLNIIYDKLDI